MYDGLANRLHEELKALAPQNVGIKLIGDNGTAKFASWMGASAFASMPSFEASWITKDEYEENGETIVHRKCA